MNPKNLIVTGILWAAAIIASALVQAPAILSGLLLPSLAFCSLTVMASDWKKECRQKTTR